MAKKITEPRVLMLGDISALDNWRLNFGSVFLSLICNS